LVALALWWLVGWSLAPLGRVAAAARQRHAGALEPLPADGLPSEVMPVVDAFNALLGRLDSAFGAQRNFVADAAHELRTPLTALKLQLELLRSSRDEQDRDAALTRLRQGVERASHLVGQLLALARAEPGQALPMADIDLVAVARMALSDAAALATSRGARIELDAPPRLQMQGDEQGLRSLLRNLVDNAVKYGGTSPNVVVRLQADEHEVRLFVDDAGPGIPTAERERAFDRFHRRDTGGGDGSGLGLAIVRAIAAQHGGSASLADSPQGGLRVELHLPRLPPGDRAGP